MTDFRYILCPECGLMLSVVGEPKTTKLVSDHRLVCQACGKGMVLFPDSDTAYAFRNAYNERKAADEKIKKLIKDATKCRGEE